MNSETVPVKVTLSVEWNGRRQSHVTSIQHLSPSHYAEESAFGAVRQMIRDVAVDAAQSFAAKPSPYTDDLFAAQVPEPKRSCCSPPKADDDSDDELDDHYHGLMNREV